MCVLTNRTNAFQLSLNKYVNKMVSRNKLNTSEGVGA